MLSDDEDDFTLAAPSPTTAPLPKASKKSLRKTKVGWTSCCLLLSLGRVMPVSDVQIASRSLPGKMQGYLMIPHLSSRKLHV
jgi:hypothetical protein